MGSDRVRPRTANGQQKLAVQQQTMKRRAPPAKNANGGAGPHQNGFAQQMPQQVYAPRSNRVLAVSARSDALQASLTVVHGDRRLRDSVLQYEEAESEPEFKAAKRVQSADLLSKLSVSIVRQGVRIACIPYCPTV